MGFRTSDLEYIKKYLDKDKLDDGIKLLEDGVSPQYIVGNVDFYGNVIEINPSVLIPRFETELLVEKTINYIKGMNFCDDVNILDVGTGSGCIAIALKKQVSCHVVGVDISLKALDVARRNARNNMVDISFLESNVFSNVGGSFDVIISNPPYIREDEKIEPIVFENEPHLALYASENGLYFYRVILEGAKNYLRKRFLIAFEIGCDQGEAVKELAYQYLDDINVSVEQDYSGRDRFVFIFSK